MTLKGLLFDSPNRLESASGAANQSFRQPEHRTQQITRSPLRSTWGARPPGLSQTNQCGAALSDRARLLLLRLPSSELVSL